MANWGSLPMEIIDEMANRLPGDRRDLIRFGCVCSSWRSVSLENMNKSWGPWMMLSEPEPSHNFLEEETLVLVNTFDEEGGDYKVYAAYDQDVPRRFFDLSTNNTFEFRLPETKGRRCLGSSLGWIFTLGLDLNIHLLNPLTRNRISLPPHHTFPKDDDEDYYDDIEDDDGDKGYLEPRVIRTVFISKFAMSSHPTNSNKVVVMVIYSGMSQLAFASPGDEAWTSLKSPPGAYDDVTFFNYHFYAIQSGTGAVKVCDITTGSVPEAIDFMSPPPQEPGCRYYLVEILGDLHVVLRLYFGDDTKVDLVNETIGFKIYKLDFFKKEWIELHDLRNHALFVGNNTAFAISISNHHSELRSNSIYFTNDFYELYKRGISDMGLFDFQEKKVIDPFYFGDGTCTTFCAPMFFIPSLH